VTRILDISLTIGPDLLTWPNDPGIEIQPTSRMSEGDAANVSELKIGTHTGTHVDPPVHFVDGAAGIDRVSLDTLFGPCVVADARGVEGRLGPVELDRMGIPDETERLLIRSDNSEIWGNLPAPFPAEYTCLSLAGASWLVRRGIRLIGVDFLSVEAKGAPGHPVHVELLTHEVVIVEGLSLGEAEPGAYTLAVLPLKILDGDGGPARAILLQG
jgi:arylformamidase